MDSSRGRAKCTRDGCACNIGITGGVINLLIAKRLGHAQACAPAVGAVAFRQDALAGGYGT